MTRRAHTQGASSETSSRRDAAQARQGGPISPPLLPEPWHFSALRPLMLGWALTLWAYVLTSLVVEVMR